MCVPPPPPPLIAHQLALRGGFRRSIVDRFASVENSSGQISAAATDASASSAVPPLVDLKVLQKELNNAWTQLSAMDDKSVFAMPVSALFS